GVCLTNRIDNSEQTNDDFWLLCEASIQNPIEIDDINLLTIENYETFIRKKDCLILSDENNSSKIINHDNQYLLWKGFIVPIGDITKRFLHLSPKQLRPRYLLNFMGKNPQI
ncbi:hypothetical protein BLA29_011458, partial [Euroglyphus maynei]